MNKERVKVPTHLLNLFPNIPIFIFLQKRTTLITETQSKKAKTEQREIREYTDSEKKEIESEYQRMIQQYHIEVEKQPKIQNMVSTIHLEIKGRDNEKVEEKLNLDKIASKCRNCEYKKSRFPALIQRITDPKSTALIFEAGKMVITGTKGAEQSHDAAQKFVKQIEKSTKLTIKISSIKTSNIVANSQLPYQVNLTKVNDDQSLKDHIAYDRSQFPGLIYKMGEPKLAALIFYSGKIVFTGAKNEFEIKKAYNYLLNVLQKHKQPQQVQ